MVDANSENTITELDDGNIKEKLNARDVALLYKSRIFPIFFRRWMAACLDNIVIIAMMALSFFATSARWILFNCILLLLYYFIIEGVTGYTLGKLVLRIRVVDNDFNPPGIRKALIRTLIRFFEVNPLLFGGLPAGIVVLLSDTRQRIGDIATGTYVLKVKDIPIPGKRLNLIKYKKVIVVSFILLTVISLAGSIFGITQRDSTASFFDDLKSDQVIYDKDERYQVTFPRGWSESKDSEFDMYVVNYLKAMYFTSISLDKSEFGPDVDMDIFAASVKTDMAKTFINSQIINTTEINVNGYPATQFEVTGEVEGEKVYALVTMIETPETFYRFIAGILDNKIDHDELDELQDAVYSFKEIETGQR